MTNKREGKADTMSYASYQTQGTLALKRRQAPGPRLAYSAPAPRARERAVKERHEGRALLVGLFLVLAFVCGGAFLLEGLLSMPEAMVGAETCYETHYVRGGETLWSIAQECAPNTMRTEEMVSLIRSHNDLSTSLLSPGQMLEIPMLGR
ncbi:MAG: LysM peptidoglycan-binding domain-containing protein [Coriobacteriales bacterium]|nr:LysM peptidoglycan-binding domain-containing protein [Coriobacteriales bacterium]